MLCCKYQAYLCKDWFGRKDSYGRKEGISLQTNRWAQKTGEQQHGLYPGCCRSHSQTTGSRHLPKRRRSSLRAGLAVIGGRAAGALSRRLRLGGGTSIAGVVAQRLYPDIISHLSTQLAYGSVLVTGTNGKTTTSGLIAATLSDAGLRVWR